MDKVPIRDRINPCLEDTDRFINKMTHILKADKEFFRLFDLKDLAQETKVKLKNNVPVRLLASVYCHVTREGMFKIHQIAREEKLVQNFLLKLDPQMENEFIFENDPMAEQLKISLITRDGFYLFMDCSELHKDIKLQVNKQFFFSGNILVIDKDVACLKLSCVTPAEGLDIDLYTKTRVLMDTLVRKNAHPFPAEAPRKEKIVEEVVEEKPAPAELEVL